MHGALIRQFLNYANYIIINFQRNETHCGDTFVCCKVRRSDGEEEKKLKISGLNSALALGEKKIRVICGNLGNYNVFQNCETKSK